METIPRWLEDSLMNGKRDDGVEKVLEVVSWSSVVSKGDNYSSDMARVTLRVLLTTGKEVTRSLLVKRIPEAEGKANWLKEWQFFTKEIMIYRDVMPRLNELLNELDDGSEPLWCQCFEFRAYDRLVLEDLKDLNYRMCNKRESLDLVHTKLAVESLARYHAMTVILKDRGTLLVEEYSNNMFTLAQDKVQHFVDTSIAVIVQVIEKTWPSEWLEYIPKLKGMEGRTIQVLKEVLEGGEDAFKVLNHGDCWLNNMLFKYDGFNGTPVGVRFVDFQLSFYNSYVYDLNYFFTTSVKLEVLDRDMDEVLETYRSSLEATFERFGHGASRAPPLEKIKEEVRGAAIVGLVVGCMGLTFMLSEPEDVVEFDQLSEEVEGESVLKLTDRPYKGKQFTQRMKYVLENCKRFGVFGDARSVAE